MASPSQGQERASGVLSGSPAPAAASVPKASVGLLARAMPIPLGGLVVLLLIALEWALFVQFFDRELRDGYPPGYDQSVYLSQAYETFDRIVKDGLWGGIRHGLLMNLPQGKMMHLQASLLMLVTGPSRLAALSLNFLYFALLQCVVVYTCVSLTKRWAIALMGVGLLLATHSRFLLAGGMADFRLDHIAFCLFGTFICLAVRSCVFRSGRWSLAAGAAGGMLILFRFQAALTMASSLGILLAIFCVTAWRNRDTAARTAMLQRVRGLLLAGATITIMVAPALWLARHELRAYYIGQAITGPQIRAAELGATGAFTYWTFYVQSLLSNHLGRACCALSAFILVVLFLAARLRPPAGHDDAESTASAFPAAGIFLAVMFLVPLAVLTVYPVRNPIVANILITPALAVVVSVAARYAGTPKPGALPSVSRTLCGLAAVTFFSGMLTELAMAPRRTYLSAERDSVRNVVQLYDEISVRSHNMGWTTPRLSVDRLQDYLFSSHVSALSHERHGFELHPEPVLGNDIRAASPSAALGAVKSSDFAVITDLSSSEGPGFAFPFNLSMKQIQPQLHETAERYLLPVRHFQAFGHRFTLYMRPAAQMTGDSGGWITSEGLTLEAPAETFRARPNIELGGVTILAEHLGKMTIRARLLTGNGDGVELPVKFDLPILPKQAIQYKVAIRVDPSRLPAAGNVRVKLSFDKYVVPKDIGFNPDTRRLVVMTPKQISLLP